MVMAAARYNMPKEMYFVWFQCLFVLIWLKVQVVIHKVFILTVWQHLWCEAFIAAALPCRASQTSFVNQAVRLCLCCLFPLIARCQSNSYR